MNRGNGEMKMFIRIGISVVILCMFFVLVVGIQIYKFGKFSKAEKSDCIIVLGCSVYGETPSPFLKSRTEEAFRLYKEGYANYIIASGGMGEGEEISEAEAIKRYLIELGMDEKYIIKEDKSTSTMENLKNSKEIMKDRSFNSAIVVSNKYHLKRASLMAKRVGIHASFSGVFVEDYINHERYGFIREIPALIKFYIS